MSQQDSKKDLGSRASKRRVNPAVVSVGVAVILSAIWGLSRVDLTPHADDDGVVPFLTYLGSPYERSCNEDHCWLYPGGDAGLSAGDAVGLCRHFGYAHAVMSPDALGPRLCCAAAAQSDVCAWPKEDIVWDDVPLRLRCKGRDCVWVATHRAERVDEAFATSLCAREGRNGVVERKNGHVSVCCESVGASVCDWPEPPYDSGHERHDDIEKDVHQQDDARAGEGDGGG